MRGKFFAQRDFANFTEAKFITFLRFCEQFMVPTDAGPKYSNTKALWLKAEEVLDMPDHPFHEYLWRINFMSTDPKATYRKFFVKLLTLMNGVLKFLQRNPSLITDDMRKIMKMYPRFEWALTQTTIVSTAIGADVVVQKNGLAPFDERLYNAGVKVVDVLERLADSITDKDIRGMTPRDKMIAMGRMGYIFTIAKNLKPNKQIFNQININASSREDLEASLLAVSRKQ